MSDTDKAERELRELAREVIGLIELQQQFFRCRTNELLTECKQLERKLGRKCKAILNPAAAEPPPLPGM